MDIASLSPISFAAQLQTSSAGAAEKGNQLEAGGQPDPRKTFDTFVGETFYGQMLGAMRKTVGKPAYFDGGRAEEVFRGQLDQILAGKLSEASAGSFSGPMYELFQLSRS